MLGPVVLAGRTVIDDDPTGDTDDPLPSAAASDITSQSDAQTKAQRSRREEVPIRQPRMIIGRNARRATKHPLINHESCCRIRRRHLRQRGNPGYGLYALDVHRHTFAVEPGGSLRQTLAAGCSARTSDQLMRSPPSPTFPPREAMPGPAGVGVRLAVADVDDRNRRVNGCSPFNV